MSTNTPESEPGAEKSITRPEVSIEGLETLLDSMAERSVKCKRLASYAKSGEGSGEFRDMGPLDAAQQADEERAKLLDTAEILDSVLPNPGGGSWLDEVDQRATRFIEEETQATA